MLIAEHAECGGAEGKEPAGCGGQSQPRCGGNTEEMPAGEDEHVAVDRSPPRNHAIRANSDVCQAFAMWAAVAEKLPAGPFLEDVHGLPTFTIAVVPFDEVGIHLGHRAKA